MLFRDYAGEVHIKLARHHECPVGEDDHAMLWRYITAVNESVGCLAFDLDTSTQLDPTLDVEEARVTVLADMTGAPTHLRQGPETISSLDDWFRLAPPEKGAVQWKDGRSAKELAPPVARSSVTHPR